MSLSLVFGLVCGVAAHADGNSPQEASHHMLEESDCLCLHQTDNHIAQYGADGIETFICGADITQASVIKQDLLDDEDGNCLGELASCLHDSKAERYYFGGEEERDCG